MENIPCHSQNKRYWSVEGLRGQFEAILKQKLEAETDVDIDVSDLMTPDKIKSNFEKIEKLVENDHEGKKRDLKIEGKINAKSLNSIIRQQKVLEIYEKLDLAEVQDS